MKTLDGLFFCEYCYLKEVIQCWFLIIFTTCITILFLLTLGAYMYAISRLSVAEDEVRALSEKTEYCKLK